MSDKIRILVVDHDPDVLLATSRLLKEAGYEVLEASSGKETLKVVKEDHPDLVLLEVVLPDMDGTEVCKRIKADPSLRRPLVVLSSGVRTSSESQAEGLEGGAAGYIPRPIPDRELLARVQGLVRLKQAEEALQASETRYRRLFETAQDGVLILDADTGRITDVNPFLVEMLGYAHEDLLGKKLWEIGAFKDIGLSKAAFSELQTKGYVRYEDLPLQAKNGRLMDVEFVSNVYLVNHHRVIQCNIRDITERRLAEEALRRAHYELEEGAKERTADLATAIEQLVASNKALEERLKFEALLADFSAHFVNLSADRVDSEIKDAQRRICELFDLDRSTLWQVSQSEPGTMLLTHMHQPPGGPPVPERMDARDFFPWAIEKVMSGEHLVISKLADLPLEAARDRETLRSYGTKSSLVVPLSTGRGKVFGALSFAVMREERDWQEPMVKRLRLVAELFANALGRKQMEEQLRGHLQEIEQLKQRLERENIYLQEEIRLLGDHTEIVGQSPTMRKILAQAEQVARTDSTVLILGETGTGKELLARAIHRMSTRKDRPLVTVSCASLPPTLIEGELFGRERGAYTGALTKMIGRFEIADGSTLFLDEIGEIPLDLQSKLLRVLEEGNFERLGSTKTLQVNVRIIAATNRDIAQDVKEGKFRTDLFYRLNVFPIAVAPLRERREDIPLMVWAFVKEFQKKMGKEIESISRKTMEALQSYSWPGNVRELRNTIEHAMIVSSGKTLVVPLPHLASLEADATRNLEDVERRHIVSVLEGTSWRVAGKDGAAEVLGLKRSTLYSKMKKLGIRRPAT